MLSKSWTRAQVNDFMKKQVNRGLGVKCDHCHDKNDFASDANEHKVIARKMMQMTRSLDKQEITTARVDVKDGAFLYEVS